MVIPNPSVVTLVALRLVDSAPLNPQIVPNSSATVANNSHPQIPKILTPPPPPPVSNNTNHPIVSMPKTGEVQHQTQVQPPQPLPLQSHSHSQSSQLQAQLHHQVQQQKTIQNGPVVVPVASYIHQQQPPQSLQYPAQANQV